MRLGYFEAVANIPLVLFTIFSFTLAHARPLASGLVDCAHSLISTDSGSPVLVYAIDADAFLSDAELFQSTALFDRLIALDPTPIEHQSEFYFRVDNPFEGTKSFDPRTDPLTSGPYKPNKKNVPVNPNAADRRWIDAIAERALLRILAHAKNPAFDRGYFERYPEYKIRTFGIRYTLPRSGIIEGVSFHQDGCRYQAIVVLHRPPFVSGGENLFQETGTFLDDREKLSTNARGAGNGIGVPVVHSVRPAENRLLVFDGLNTRHAVDGFKILAEPENDEARKPRIRDVWGFCVF